MKNFTWNDFQNIFFNTLYVIVIAAMLFSYNARMEKQNMEKLELEKNWSTIERKDIKNLQLKRDQLIIEDKVYDLKMKTELFDKISNASADIMTAAFYAGLQCEKSADQNNRKIVDANVSRYRAQGTLQGLQYQIELFFGPELNQAINSYLLFDAKNKNFCSSGFPKEEYMAKRNDMIKPFIKNIQETQETVKI